MTSRRPLTIFVINSDWRDIFRTDREELHEKLERDQLEPDINSFFFLSWSKHWYHLSSGASETVHLPLMTPVFKPIADLVLLLLGPCIAWWYDARPDVVLVYDFGSLPAARLIARRTRARVIMYLNNIPEEYSKTRRWGGIKSRYSRVLEWLWGWIPDAYCTINETLRAHLEERVGAKRIFLYSVNTIVRDRRYVEASAPGRVRSELGISPHATMILSVGRLEAEKNHGRLFRYVAALPEAHLVLLGEGSLRPELETLVRTLSIEGRVHLVGSVRRNRIWDYYRDASVFVLLSKAEALGIVFWEAMQVRVPTIGSDLPGIVESLGRERERGIILADDASEEDFAAALAFATTPSPAREAMLDRAAAFVAEGVRSGMTINAVVAAL